MERKVIIRNRHLKLRIDLDANQVFPNDPGQGTPAMVTLEDPKLDNPSATFNCATGTGELDCGSYQLTQEQSDWLDSKVNEVDEWLTYWVNKITERLDN